MGLCRRDWSRFMSARSRDAGWAPGNRPKRHESRRQFDRADSDSRFCAHPPDVAVGPFVRSSVRRIYFDYNATTPLDPKVRAAMEPYWGNIWGNPSSIHQVGRQARAALDDARYRLAALWQCRPSEVVFTSGGTESNNLAVFGTARRLRDRGRHLIT